MTNPNEPGEFERKPGTRNLAGGIAGSHPVGTAVGGVAGGVTARAIARTIFGSIGTLVGAGIGVVAGAAVGPGVVERIDPTGEPDYWRSVYDTRPYAKHEYDFERDYLPAYKVGLHAHEKYGTRAFDQNDSVLRDGWNQARGESRLSWEAARPAIADAFNRAERTLRTYADSDRHVESRFEEITYADVSETFVDYRPAYRYGLLARARFDARA